MILRSAAAAAAVATTSGEGSWQGFGRRGRWTNYWRWRKDRRHMKSARGRDQREIWLWLYRLYIEQSERYFEHSNGHWRLHFQLPWRGEMQEWRSTLRILWYTSDDLSFEEQSYQAALDWSRLDLLMKLRFTKSSMIRLRCMPFNRSGVSTALSLSLFLDTSFRLRLFHKPQSSKCALIPCPGSLSTLGSDGDIQDQKY